MGSSGSKPNGQQRHLKYRNILLCPFIDKHDVKDNDEMITTMVHGDVQ